MPRDDDLIAAIATAPGKGGIGVVRISGPAIGAVMHGLLGRAIEPRKASVCAFRDAAGRAIDDGVALYFEAPRSYTGEHVLELQGHGGPVVLEMVLRRALALGCRLADPGEFTRRAFLNDKIDLAQAESVADLIEASSARAARAAMRSLEGAFSTEIALLRDRLVELRALVEATLDFPEEELEFLQQERAAERLAGLDQAIEGVLARARTGARLRRGFCVVLAGRPNVGKSSLLNALAGEDAAIVTAVAGTTRDTVSRAIEIDGLTLELVDTAGLRETEDEVETVGIERARRAVARADLVLHVVDAAGATAEDEAIAASFPDAVARLTVRNKIDAARLPVTALADAVSVSALTGEGLAALRGELLKRGGLDGAGEDAFIARERHVEAIEVARARVH